MNIREIIEHFENVPESGEMHEEEGYFISKVYAEEIVRCLKDCGTYFRIPRPADGKYDWVENISEDSGEDGIIHPWG